MFHLSNQRTTILHAKNCLKVAICCESESFLGSQYTLMSQWLRLVTVSLATWVLFHWVWSSPLSNLCGTEPVSALTVSALTLMIYIAALSVIFSLGFCQWWSSADRPEGLNYQHNDPTSLLARGQDSATCAGLAHQCNYRYCTAYYSLRTKATEKARPLFFL